MKRVQFILLAAFAVYSVSCTDNRVANTADTTTTEPPADTIAQEHRHGTDEKIVLNDGKKWTVDPPMLAHLRNMETEVHSFSEKKSTDYAALASSLEHHLDLLTSNCTMKGQAHDELHKWLLPFIDLADEFGAAETQEEAAALFAEIETSFTTFNVYFE